MRDPYQQYRAMTVETASPVQLVTMLYQGVLRFTLRGIQGIEQGNIAQAHEGLTRAQAIVMELAAHLDKKAGGEIAENLNALYLYANQRLVEANCRKDAAPAAEVVRLFRELLPAWQALAEGRRDGLALAGAGGRERAS
ncbi:MAG TPA: flagellar export chaperone FliS [Chloroflexota bacterium]|nr:flagellar export chaperone FliS [Chloroflexota bacterium]